MKEDHQTYGITELDTKLVEVDWIHAHWSEYFMKR